MTVKLYQPYNAVHSAFFRQYETELTEEFKKSIEKIPELVEVSNAYKNYLCAFVENGLRHNEELSSYYIDLFKNMDEKFKNPAIKKKIKKIVMDNVQKMFFLNKENELYDMRNGSYLDNVGILHFSIDNLSVQEKSLSYNDRNFELNTVAKILSALSVSDKPLTFNVSKLEKSLTEMVSDMGFEKLYEIGEEEKIENVYKKVMNTSYPHLKIESSESIKLLIKNIFSSLSYPEIDVFSPLLATMINNNNDSLFSLKNLQNKHSFKGSAQYKYLSILDKNMFSEYQKKCLSFILRKNSCLENMLYHFSHLNLPSMDTYEEKVEENNNSDFPLFNMRKMFEETIEESCVLLRDYVLSLKKQWLKNSKMFSSEEINNILKEKYLQHFNYGNYFNLLFEIKQAKPHVQMNERVLTLIMDLDEEKEEILQKIEKVNDINLLITQEYTNITKEDKNFNALTQNIKNHLSNKYKNLILADEQESDKVMDIWIANPNLFKERITCYTENEHVGIISTANGESIRIKDISSSETFISAFKDSIFFEDHTRSPENFFTLLLNKKICHNYDIIINLYILFMNKNRYTHTYDVYALLLMNKSLSIKEKNEIIDVLLSFDIYPVTKIENYAQTLMVLLSENDVNYEQLDLFFSILNKINIKQHSCDILNNYTRTGAWSYNHHSLALIYKSKEQLDYIFKKILYVYEKYNVSFINEETKINSLGILNDHPEFSEYFYSLNASESIMKAYHEERKIYQAFLKIDIELMLYYIKNNGLKIDDSFTYTCDKKIYDFFFDPSYKYRDNMYKITSEQWQQLFNDITISMIEKSHRLKEKLSHNSDKKEFEEENLYTLLLINNGEGIFDAVLRHIIIDLGYVCSIEEKNMTGRISDSTRIKLTEWENEKQRRNLHSLIKQSYVENTVKRI